jgi:hypothetical protein
VSQGPSDPLVPGTPPEPPSPPGYQQQASSQPGYGQPPAYGQPGYGQPQSAPPQKTPTMAIVGLILAFAFWPVGLVMSIVALVKSKVNGGKGVAIAGVILGVLMMLTTVLVVVFTIFVINTGRGPTDAVTTMNESFIDDDCETFMAVTTDTYRSQIGVTDCDVWDELHAQTFGGMTELTTQIVNVNIENSTATVTTVETFTFNGESNKVNGIYTVINEDGTWRIDNAG